MRILLFLLLTLSLYAQQLFVKDTTYTGNASEVVVALNLGVAIEFIMIKGATSASHQFACFKTDKMGVDSTASLVAEANFTGGITLSGDDFSVGNAAQVNQSGVTYYVTAMGGSSCETGKFIGTGAQIVVNTTISPGFVMAKAAGTQACGWKSLTIPAGASSGLLNAADAVNYISAIGANSFTVQNLVSVNTVFATWVAISDQDSMVDYGNFTSNNLDDTDINLNHNWLADLVTVDRATTATTSIFKPYILAGDNGLRFDNLGGLRPNTIQSISKGKFNIGNDVTVNPAGSVGVNWFAWRPYYPCTITSLSVQSGSPGTPVTITGTNFSGVTSVSFNGTAASYTVNSLTQIATTVPAGATTGTITVTNPYNTAASSTFTISATDSKFLQHNKCNKFKGW